jgi:hypothetical protein
MLQPLLESMSASGLRMATCQVPQPSGSMSRLECLELHDSNLSALAVFGSPFAIARRAAYYMPEADTAD